MVSLSRVAFVTFGVIHGANAWGALGHATVAYVAQHYMSPEAAKWAKTVLNDTSDSYLANIASWADSYRKTDEGKWSAPLHYIDAMDDPPTSCNVDYERDCPAEGCSISAIANYTQRAGNLKLSTPETAEALRFLVHIIGDLVQPLHDENYEVGGNGIEVTFDNYTDNLHSDWDTYIPQKLVGGSSLEDAQGWAESLVHEIKAGSYKKEAKKWTKGDDIGNTIKSATRWAADANAYICTVVMPDGAAALQTGDLYPTYYNSVIGTIEIQIAKGGYRLANWLNTIYKQKIKHSKGGKFGKGPRDAAPEPEFVYKPREPRQMSRANMARAAMGGSCCKSGREHSH
ncbi:S1/P1 nuclease [Penicillium robsamsonii]|uniref:S1/P1 nuclease n=1 Tax=Penicillium robsamsonii TaxID=1792511 RepID=UPI00254861D9|nr:S1/P1 nuclease [Penicillium robsamsonii]KAJ5836271.1 S1/P1 nuclease [Penicillium robsamsonii]